jgi:hypothetical protein
MRTATHHGRPAAIAALALLVVVALWGGVARASIVDDNGAEPVWTLTFGNPGGDAAYDVVMTPTLTWFCGQQSTADNGLDATLRKVDNASTVTVSHSYDSPKHLNDAAYALAVRGSQAIYTAGATRKSAANLDMLVVAWRSSGAVKWARTWGSGGTNTDQAVDVGVDGKRNVIACGTRQTTATSQDWVVVSWTPNGTKRWVWTYSGSAGGMDAPRALSVDKAGNTYVTGTTMLSLTKIVCMTVKLSPTGKKLWLKKYTGADDLGAEGSTAAGCPAGGVYVGGFEIKTATGADALLLRYSPKGARTVFATWDGGAVGGTRTQDVRSIAVTTTGKIVGVGRHNDPATNDPLRVVWNPDGSLFDHVIDMTPTPYDDVWKDVAADGSGGYCMTGTWPNPASSLGVRTLRRSTWIDGGEWGYAWDGPVDSTLTSPYAVAANGTCYAVVGAVESAGADMNQFIEFWRY